MATFVLVHGAWHGAWCWDRLTPELESKGHRTIAMDLPCDDGAATFDDYADVVCDAVRGVDGQDLILVGHSLAGQTIPLVAARQSVRRVVYLCALLPVPGIALAQQMAEDESMLNPDYAMGLSEKDIHGRRTWVDEEVACRHLFGDCDDDTASAAFARLCPQATHPYRLPCSLTELPRVDNTYILCAEDRMVNPDWSRRMARERLGADVVEMAGSHSPFLSRPGALADVLHGLA
ncbi:alpha/beta fold hydrolase [Mycobacterium deserti]|uniref:Alpha/beta fold hydrolase n=1 Tax=Mycobacterium deserti TaxID=2978347 RepID=A0ABT2M6A0_9MYCO|nr:alpha/beta fold hydrolase [Mycobacterium deserti]MCT7657782.1 alpha/beta fold hydrolase [Mycobacterium deserti]